MRVLICKTFKHLTKVQVIMLEDIELGVLVANVVGEVRFSHCRLCLKVIEENYASFEDLVCVEQDYVPLSSLLIDFLGPEGCEAIAGVDAVCIDCVEQMTILKQFLRKCEESSRTLSKVLNSMINTLNSDINTDKLQKLFITVREDDSKLIFVDKPTKQEQVVNLPTRGMFPCPSCSHKLNTLEEFKDHTMVKHFVMTCFKCSETFTSERELAIHEIHSEVQKCPDCHVIKCSAESLKKHSEKIHDLFVCKECGKICRGSDRLHKHEDMHVTKNECAKCGKVYTTKEFYMKHVKLCLEDKIDLHPVRSKLEKKYSCSECSKRYSTTGGLRVHLRFVHGNAKPHTCPHCNKQFTAPSYLKTHMIKHTGEKNFKCDICSKKFVSKEALLYHTRRHTGEKPYSCTICEEKFVNASARAEHIKFKHVGPTLMCEICSRKFVTRNFLRLHLKKHHDPSNKLYVGRMTVPPNVPAQENMRVRLTGEEFLSY